MGQPRLTEHDSPPEINFDRVDPIVQRHLPVRVLFRFTFPTFRYTPLLSVYQADHGEIQLSDSRVAYKEDLTFERRPSFHI